MILFHTSMSCHVLMTYALQQQALTSGSQFALSHSAIPKTLCFLQRVEPGTP